MFKKLKLITKINIIVAITLATTIAIIGYLNNGLETKHTILLSIDSARRITDYFLKDMNELMASNNLPQIQNRLDEIKSGHPGIVEIGLCNDKGLIVASTDKNNISKTIDRSEAECMICHSGDPPLDRISEGMIGDMAVSGSGDKVIRIVTPISTILP